MTPLHPSWLAPRETVAAPFMCGTCGERFGNKNAKRRHKLACAPVASSFAPVDPNEVTDDADLYGFGPAQARRHLASLSPERRALLESEWA